MSKTFTEALAAHQNPEAQAAMRRRKLPLDRALWLTIGMGLFRDRSIHEVVEHLELAIPKAGPRGGVAPSAVPAARSRLGAEPVRAPTRATLRSSGLRPHPCREAASFNNYRTVFARGSSASKRSCSPVARSC